MPFPVIPAAFLAGGLIGGNLLNKKYDYTKPPEELMMSDADVNAQYQQILGDLSMTQQGQIAGIKQVGAANRLPAGATQTAISEAGRNTARGAARALPGLKENQRRSKIDYYNLLNRYEQLQAGQQGAQQQFTQSGLGALGQVLTLWQAGMFNKPGAGGAQGGMMNPNSILQNAPYQQPPYDPNQYYGMMG